MCIRDSYNLMPKSYEVVRRIDLEKIYKISVSEENSSLCGIHVKDEFDYLIHIFRRTTMINFLHDLFQHRGFEAFLCTATKEFSIKHRNSTLKNIKDGETTGSFINNAIQDSYYRSFYLGYLDIKSEVLMMVRWDEYFFVLTNIGFIYFNKPEDLKPAGFIPISYELDEKPQRPDKPFSFKLGTFVLSAKSNAEKVVCLDALRFIRLHKADGRASVSSVNSMR
eukprot:TRINITY_DN7411_c0_g1_i3.p1 TRINITY_DN7411_c0_g1~~TRINITY_DN7411_c0_g1_i3.p1  ORF type:complete len:262 (-),score=32.04 TRINITY_DN7411_c0_g1_i3:287-955(-)